MLRTEAHRLTREAINSKKLAEEKAIERVDSIFEENVKFIENAERTILQSIYLTVKYFAEQGDDNFAWTPEDDILGKLEQYEFTLNLLFNESKTKDELVRRLINRVVSRLRKDGYTVAATGVYTPPPLTYRISW